MNDLAAHIPSGTTEQQTDQVTPSNDSNCMTAISLCNTRCSGTYPGISPDLYERDIRRVLERVRRNIPKVFVNLVSMLNMSEVLAVCVYSGACLTINALTT